MNKSLFFHSIEQLHGTQFRSECETNTQSGKMSEIGSLVHMLSDRDQNKTSFAELMSKQCGSGLATENLEFGSEIADDLA